MEEAVLLQYRDMLEEIKDLEKRIKELEEPSVKSPNLDGMPKAKGYIGGDPQSTVLIEKDKLIWQLKKAREDALYKCYTVEELIESIPDPVDRRIARYRYLDGMFWHQIQMKIGMSEPNLYRRRKNILENVK